MILTRDLAADLSGAGDLAGDLSLLTTLAATLDGSSGVSGDLALLIALAADLAGVGAVDASTDLKLRVNFDTELAGAGAVTGNLVGNASLEANIFVNSGSATTQEIVEAVWSAIAADYFAAGTMGEKLNDAGGAADPWDDVRALTVGKFLGLK